MLMTDEERDFKKLFIRRWWDRSGGIGELKLNTTDKVLNDHYELAKEANRSLDGVINMQLLMSGLYTLE